mmetsp:Transcript_125755/g.361550  ORF Transcript_125755/g.361550 Transcript_125755/m.361550 type:complete len:300 (+) Transcript_125755:671-1570(+)
MVHCERRLEAADFLVLGVDAWELVLALQLRAACLAAPPAHQHGAAARRHEEAAQDPGGLDAATHAVPAFAEGAAHRRRAFRVLLANHLVVGLGVGADFSDAADVIAGGTVHRAAGAAAAALLAARAPRASEPLHRRDDEVFEEGRRRHGGDGHGDRRRRGACNFQRLLQHIQETVGAAVNVLVGEERLVRFRHVADVLGRDVVVDKHGHVHLHNVLVLAIRLPLVLLQQPRRALQQPHRALDVRAAAAPDAADPELNLDAAGAHTELLRDSDEECAPIRRGPLVAAVRVRAVVDVTAAA